MSQGSRPAAAPPNQRLATVARLQERRRRDRIAAACVVLVAIAAGIVAGRLGTHRAWEEPQHASTTAPSGQSQGSQ